MLEFQWSKNYKESEFLFVRLIDSVSEQQLSAPTLQVKIIPYKHYTLEGPVWSLANVVAEQSMYWRMFSLERIAATYFKHLPSKIERNKVIHHVATLRSIGIADI